VRHPRVPGDRLHAERGLSVKLLDRKKPAENDAIAAVEAQLLDVVEKLTAANQKEADAAAALERAEQKLVNAQALVSDEFHGTVAPDAAARERAEAERDAHAARRAAEHATAVREAGEAEAVRLVDELYELRDDARQAQIVAESTLIADAKTTILGAEARLQQLADAKFADERAHLDARRFVQGRGGVDWQARDAAQVRRWVEGTRRQQVGVDPLPPRLQPVADARLAALQSEGISPEYLREVARRGGYTLLRDDGGATRLTLREPS
jgi:hypothetical protein